jgi:hypothetical protein
MYAANKSIDFLHASSIYDDFDEVDSAFFEQVDELTARALSAPNPIQNNSSDNFDFMDLDNVALAEIDKLEAAALQSTSQPATRNPANLSQFIQNPQSVCRQSTLFGNIVQSSPKRGSQNVLHSTSQSRSPFGPNVKKAKIWSGDAFKKYGWKIKKGKQFSSDEDEDNGYEDKQERDFEQFPDPINNGD